MISVVHQGQLLAALLLGESVGLGEFPDAFRETVREVCLGHSADVRVAGVHRDVLGVVQVAEHAHLPDLGDTSEEAQADAPVLGLHHAVEAAELLADLVTQFRAVKVVDDGLVIFIDKDHHLTASLPVGGLDYGLEADGKRLVLPDDPIF